MILEAPYICPIYMTDEDIDRLRSIAARLGVSEDEAVSKALQDYEFKLNTAELYDKLR